MCPRAELDLCCVFRVLCLQQEAGEQLLALALGFSSSSELYSYGCLGIQVFSKLKSTFPCRRVQGQASPGLTQSMKPGQPAVPIISGPLPCPPCFHSLCSACILAALDQLKDGIQPPETPPRAACNPLAWVVLLPGFRAAMSAWKYGTLRKASKAMGAAVQLPGNPRSTACS